MIDTRKEPSGADLLAYRSYGDWDVQRPEHGTLGRYSPGMTKILPDGHTVALTLRLNHAVYQPYYGVRAGHGQALHNSLPCLARAGTHSALGLGTWEVELQVPPSDRMELVIMLWSQDNQDWLRGEINLLEGRVDTGRTLINPHWSDPGTDEPAHVPEETDFDLTLRHRYRADIVLGFVRWLAGGWFHRELSTPHTPHDLPLHLVVQTRVNPTIREDWHDDLERGQTILFRPLWTPGVCA